MIPLILNVVVRAAPLLVRIGGVLTKIPGVSGFLGLLARLAPWAGGILGWLAVDYSAQWVARMMSKVTQAAQYAWHYDWGKSEKQLLEEIKNSIENLYSPLGEALGRSIAALIVGRRFGGGSDGIPTLHINPGAIASLIELTGGLESVRETLIESVASIWMAVKNAAIAILIKYLHLNGRKMWEKKIGALPKESHSFIFAEKFEEGVKKLIPNEKVAEAVIEGFEAFFDTLGDLLTEQDTFVKFVK
jgi:hypothetical protein